jgi:hypothetical protein
VAVSFGTIAPVLLLGFALRSCVVSWSKRFDEPIVLEDGTTLRTLRDAIQYLAKTVPKAEQEHETVTNAADHLTRSAEQNYPMFFARAATPQAIHRNKERLFNPDRNDHHLGQAKAEERL